MKGRYRRQRRGGQSVLEIVILIVAVLAVMIAFTSKNGPFSTSVNGLMALPSDLIQKSDKQINFDVSATVP